MIQRRSRALRLFPFRGGLLGQSDNAIRNLARVAAGFKRRLDVVPLPRNERAEKTTNCYSSLRTLIMSSRDGCYIYFVCYTTSAMKRV